MTNVRAGDAKKNKDKARLEQIAKDQIDVQVERENVNNVDFNELFTDNLPPEAIDLGEFVTQMKDRDTNGVAKTAQIRENAFSNLEKVRKIATHTQSFYKMVTDIIQPPDGYSLVRQ